MNPLIIGSKGYLASNFISYLKLRNINFVSVSHNPSINRDEFFDLKNPLTYENILNLIKNGKITHLIDFAGLGVTAAKVDKLEMFQFNALLKKEFYERLAKGLDKEISVINIESATHLISNTEFESDYSYSKYVGLQNVKEATDFSAIKLINIYLHNVYGRNQPTGRFIIDLINAIKNGNKLYVNYPERVRDFCFIDDVSFNIYKLLISNDETSLNFEMGTSVGSSLLEVAETLSELCGIEINEFIDFSQSKSDAFPVLTAGNSHLPLLRCETSLKLGLRRCI